MIAPWNVKTHLEDFVKQGKILHAEAKNKNLGDNEHLPYVAYINVTCESV